jgi:hypothetical protein
MVHAAADFAGLWWPGQDRDVIAGAGRHSVDGAFVGLLIIVPIGFSVDKKAVYHDSSFTP